MTGQIRCHYDVLGVARDDDAAFIKKRHRKLAIKFHPDKNMSKSDEEQAEAAAEFKLIQAAYECLSDPIERKWYDEHRDMILRGGVAGSADGDGSSFIFDVVPFHFAGCYNGYDDDGPDNFYSVYCEVFEQIFQGEKDGFLSEGNIDTDKMANSELGEVEFGNSRSSWKDVSAFYCTWEGFTSSLSFAWEDAYHLHDIKEAPNRRIRRLMEDENNKKRKAAKKARVEEVTSLLRFVKNRDPRVMAQREKNLRERRTKEEERIKEQTRRKQEHLDMKREWQAEQELRLAEQEQADLDAGRIRLADLDSEDEYDYGGGKRRNRKGKKKKKKEEEDEVQEDEVHRQQQCDDDEHDDDGGDVDETDVFKDDSSSGEESEDGEDTSAEEEEPDSWRCECCRKDFKSEAQFENHLKSKKHKESVKKYEKKHGRTVELVQEGTRVFLI